MRDQLSGICCFSHISFGICISGETLLPAKSSTRCPDAVSRSASDIAR